MDNISDILRRLRESRSGNGLAPHSDGAAASTGSAASESDEDVCPVCEGRQWLMSSAAVGEPDFGKAVPCVCRQDAIENERSSRLRRYSNLGPLSRKTFDTLKPDGRFNDTGSRSLFGAAYRRALAYAQEPRGWLVITGPNGSGKTHLAAAIANLRIEMGRPVFFIHVPDLLDDLRSTYAPSSDISYSDLFEQVNDAPLLILDGLGSQSQTPWAQEKLQQIFNRRANAELPTIITTATDIGDLDPYITSRMTDPDLSSVVETGGRESDSTGRFGQIPAQMADRMTFDSFDTNGNGCTAQQRRTLEYALLASRAFAENPDGWLTLTGNTGVGKTHLAVAIASERLGRGHSAFFAFVPEMMDFLRDTFGPNSVMSYGQAFDQVKNAPLLVLDDLLPEKDFSDWSHDRLYHLLVHRHNHRLPTVITSWRNLASPDIAGPISSRIRDEQVCQLIPMSAQDYRGEPERPIRRPRGG